MVYVGRSHVVDGGTILMVADTLEELHLTATSGKVPARQFSGRDGSAKLRPHYWLSVEQRDVIAGLGRQNIRIVDFVCV